MLEDSPVQLASRSQVTDLHFSYFHKTMMRDLDNLVGVGICTRGPQPVLVYRWYADVNRWFVAQLIRKETYITQLKK